MQTPQVTPGKVPFFLSSAPYPPQVLLRPALLNRFRPLLVPLVLPIALDLRQPSTMNLKAVFFWNSSCQGKSTCCPPFFGSVPFLPFFSHSNAPRSNVSDASQRLSPPTGSSPSYSLVGPSQQQPELSSYYESELVSPQTLNSEPIQAVAQAGQPQMQGSPQPNKTMFDFVSPFDALAPSSVSPGRKHGPPVSHQQGSLEPFEDTWSSVIDPKRKSVDNLLDQLNIPKSAAPSSAHPFDQHSLDEETPIAEPVQSKATSRPLPPKPMQAPSPRASPPKTSPPARRDVQVPEPPLGPQVGPPLSHMPTAQTQRDKESSPGPRGSWKGHEGGRNRGSGSRMKTQTGPM